MVMETVVKVKALHKTFGEVKALADINFEVPGGELFGLIGPDGAGKTTLIRILTSLMLAEQGTAEVLGLDAVKDYKQLRKRIGYMPGKFSLYEDLSVEENLELFAAIFGTTIKENYHLIQDIYDQIAPFKKRRAGKLSGGMKQKLALSCAMIHAPEIIFLDEPTTGVDPVSRKEFWQMLDRLKKEGITILVSTPYMDEAGLCDRVALIQNGRMLKIETPEQIEKDYEFPIWSVNTNRKRHIINDIRKFPHCRSAFMFGSEAHYTDLRNLDFPDGLYEHLTELGHEEIDIKTIRPVIEACFMALMKPKETTHA
jgi:ABC-2 type transport system ATP-binding protein